MSSQAVLRRHTRVPWLAGNVACTELTEFGAWGCGTCAAAGNRGGGLQHLVVHAGERQYAKAALEETAAPVVGALASAWGWLLDALVALKDRITGARTRIALLQLSSQ